VCASHASAIDAADTIAVHSSALTFAEGAVPEWVELVPAGEFSGIDKRGPYKLVDPEAVIALSNQKAADAFGMPIDYGHALEADAGAAAAGWIIALEARNGAIWGKVDWTPPAKEKIANREYRGLSPVFYHDASGVVGYIARAGLTNKPNLRIKSLNAQAGGDQSMSDKEKAIVGRILALFGLPDTSDENAIVARCSAALEAEGVVGKVIPALKLDAKATSDEVLKAVNAVQSAASTVDLTKFVPIAQYEAVTTELTQARQSQTDAAVDAAVTAGKITPASRDWAKALHAANPAAFKEFVDKAPVILNGGAEARATIDSSSKTLTESEKAICAQTGVSEEQFLKAKSTTETK
jgi:phage I-like protein